jgi:hypothetical protein
MKTTAALRDFTAVIWRDSKGTVGRHAGSSKVDRPLRHPPVRLAPMPNNRGFAAKILTLVW